VLAGKGYRKWAWFRCPADTSEVIQLALMQSRRPRWGVSVDLLGRPSLHPSVRQLEGGIAVRQGLRFLRHALPDILANRADILTPRMVNLIEDLAGYLHHLDQRIDQVTGEMMRFCNMI
jgi:Family of unknown function (DUF6527)